MAEASSSRAAEQSDRISQYSVKKPDIPTDRADPTAAVPPLPPGSIKEHFASTNTVNSVGVVIILGLLAAAILYRRRR